MITVQEHISLAPYTTLRLGGPARYFVEATSISDVQEAVAWARKHGVPFFILGGGANTLVADEGYPGLVIKSNILGMRVLEKVVARAIPQTIDVRLGATQTPPTYLFDTVVEVGSGVAIPAFTLWLLSQGFSGFEWFAGIPGTTGGAIFNNIHGRDQMWNDRLVEVTVVDREGKVVTLTREQLDSAYDYSILHKTRSCVISSKLLVSSLGDIAATKATYQEWFRKKAVVQEKKGSAGSTFQNFPEADVEKYNLPTSHMGELLDKYLGLKGFERNGVQISPLHANFMVNRGGTATDYLAMIRFVQEQVHKKYGVAPRCEIELVGFE